MFDFVSPMLLVQPFYALFLNILAYTVALLLVVATLLMFTTRAGATSTTLTALSDHTQSRLAVTLSILSLSGVPPLFGFFAKFLLITLLTSKSAWFFFLIFMSFNLFSLYFYFQHLRYTIASSQRREFVVTLGPTHLSSSGAVAFGLLSLSLIFGGLFFEALVLTLSIIGA